MTRIGGGNVVETMYIGRAEVQGRFALRGHDQFAAAVDVEVDKEAFGAVAKGKVTAVGVVVGGIEKGDARGDAVTATLKGADIVGGDGMIVLVANVAFIRILDEPGCFAKVVGRSGRTTATAALGEALRRGVVARWFGGIV